MQLLLTGANGFLGAHLAQAFGQLGHDVIAVIRGEADAGRLDAVHRVSIRRCEVGQRLDELAASINWDGAIHIATAYGRSGESIANICETNVQLSLRLLELARARGAFFINADTVLPPLMNAYALSKYQFAQWGRMLSSASGPAFINLRLQHFYGADDGQHKFLRWLVRNCCESNGEIKLSQGEQIRDFIHVRDVVTAFVMILQNLGRFPNGFHEFEVGTGVGLPLRRIVEMVHEMTSSTARLVFGAIEYRPYELIPCVADITALKDLGWSPAIDLASGLQELIGETAK